MTKQFYQNITLNYPTLDKIFLWGIKQQSHLEKYAFCQQFLFHIFMIKNKTLHKIHPNIFNHVLLCVTEITFKKLYSSSHVRLTLKKQKYYYNYTEVYLKQIKLLKIFTNINKF